MLTKLNTLGDKTNTSEQGLEGNYPHMVKVAYDKSAAIVLNGERLKAFLPRSRASSGLLKPLLFNELLEIPAEQLGKKKK
jgi:hypothetical protein